MKKTAITFWFFLKKYIRYGRLPFIMSVITCLFSSTVITYLETNIIEWIINDITNSVDSVIIQTKIILVFIIQIVFVIWSQFVTHFIHDLYSVKISSGINKEILDTVLKTDMCKFDNPTFYDNYTWTANKLVIGCTQTASISISVIASVIQIITLIVVAANSNIIVAFFAIFSIIITSQIFKIVEQLKCNREIETLTHVRKQNYINRVFYIKDNIFELKTTKLPEILYKCYSNSVNRCLEIIKKYKAKLFALNIARKSVAIAVYGCLLIYLVALISNNELTIGNLSTLIVAFNLLRNSIGTISDKYLELKKITLYFDKIQSFMNTGVQSKRQDVACDNIMYDSSYEISFDNVSFRYAQSNKPVINNLTLRIPPKHTVAIVGANGVGKTTIIKLLLGLYEPNAGNIYINNRCLSEYNLNLYRNSVGVVFQQNHIWADTILNNLSIYCDVDNLPDESVYRSALKKTDVFSDLDLKTELTTEFSASGLELSGGQAQLLALTRLFIKKFNLLILDEPLSMLDPINEYKILQLIMKEFKDTTVILISHKLSSVKNADYIYLIDEGTVAEFGTHDELIKAKGKYFEMFSKQAQNYM